ncbi:MAG TPA: DUF1801 domain-containing protein [Candidatus Limnocylindria bacterium]|nr:DUF1801 domain-containing protein [Candidatus Limnocylindria bacterium]
MAAKTAAKKGAARSAKSATGKTSKGVLTAEEKAALRELAQERKAELAGKEAEAAVLAKISAMPASDRAMAKRIHAIVKASAPVLSPKLWYGMPAYAREGKIVCFFQDAAKFKSKYATFGFNHDNANLDEGNMWPSAFSLKDLTAADEARISALVKKAVS